MFLKPLRKFKIRQKFSLQFSLKLVPINIFLQYSDLGTQYKFITITIYLIMFIAEAARLYFGYEGNLREKV